MIEMTNAEIEEKSRENLIHFFKDELIKIANGATPSTHLTIAPRKRLRCYGVLVGWTGRHTVSPDVILELTREDN